MKKLLFIPLALMLSACASLMSGTDQLTYHPGIVRGQLANGLHYYLAPNANPEDRVYIRLVVNAGSINEDDDQKGVAHIVEHMAFNGTEHFPGNSVIEELEKAGMKFGLAVNAFTDFENTVYILNLPDNNPETLNLTLDIVSDWAGRVSIDKEALDAERGVVLEEWRRRLGPMLALGDKKTVIEMAGSRYTERDPIGDVNTINHVPTQRVSDFYDRWYRPDNMAIVVSGDIDNDEVLKLIKKKFSFLDTPASEMPTIDYSVPLQSGWRAGSVTEQGITNPAIELSFLDKYRPQYTKSRYREDLAISVATRLLNIRLQEWEENQQAHISSANFFSTHAGIETTQAVFSLQLKDHEFATSTQALFKVLAQIHQQGFLPVELENEKGRLKEQAKRNYDKPEYSIDIASDLITSAATGQILLSPKDRSTLNQNILASLTLEEVNKAYQKILQPENRLLLMTYGYGKDKPQIKDTEVSTWWQTIMDTPQPVYQQEKVSGELPEFTAKPGDLHLEKEWQDLGIKEYRLRNGSRLIYRFSDSNKGEIHFKALTSGGLMSVAEEDYHSARIASQLVDEYGIGELPDKVIRAALDGRPIAMSTLFDDYQQGFSGWSKAKDLPTLLHLFRIKLDQAVISDQDLSDYQREMLIRLSEVDSDPQDQFVRKISAIQYPEQPTAYSLKASEIKSLNKQKLVESYQHYIQGKTDYTYFITGDISESQLLPLVKKYLSSIQVKKQQRNARTVAVASAPERLVMELNREPRAEVEIHLGYKHPWDFKNSFQLELAGELVQEQLRQELREKASGVYSVTSWFWQNPEDNYATGRIQFSCAPDRVDELISMTNQVLDRMQKEGVAVTSLNNKKIQKADRQSRLMRSNLGWMETITQSYMATGTPELIEVAKTVNNESDKSSINQVLQTFLSESDRLEAVLAPAKS